MAKPNLIETGYQNEATTWWINNLNPADIPELMWPHNIAIYDKMRRADDQVLSVLRAVTFPIRRTPWRIDPNGCKASVAKLVADDLGLPIIGKPNKAPIRSGNKFDFDEHLRLALLKLVFGHSFFEQVYTYDKTEQLYHLKKLAWRPPRTITSLQVASDGGLESITQYGVPGNVETTIPVENLVAYVNDREGGNWLGQSLLRGAYKFWLLKEMGLRVQAQTNERNGMGVNVYKSGITLDDDSSEVRMNAEKADREAGLKAATAIRAGTRTGLSIANGAEFSTIGVDGRLPDPEKALNRYDNGIARSVLAHFLTLGGDDSTGSYALGETLEGVFTQSLQAVAKEIRTTMQQHVIEDLVDANWGPEEPAPMLVFDEIGSKGNIDAPGIMALVQSGAVQADDPLEEWIRNRFNMPGKDAATARPLPSAASKTAPTEPDEDDPAKPDEGSTTEGTPSK